MRTTLRLRATDVKLEEWLNQQENRNEAILDALNTYLFGEQPRSSQVQSHSVTAAIDTRVIADMIEAIKSVEINILDRLDKIGSIQVQASTTEAVIDELQKEVLVKQVEEDELEFLRDRAKGIMNF